MNKLKAWLKYLTIWNKIYITNFEFNKYLDRREDDTRYNGFRFKADPYRYFKYYVTYDTGDSPLNIGYIKHDIRTKKTLLFLDEDIEEALNWYERVKLSDRVKAAFRLFYDTAVYDMEEDHSVQKIKIKEALKPVIE